MDDCEGVRDGCRAWWDGRLGDVVMDLWMMALDDHCEIVKERSDESRA